MSKKSETGAVRPDGNLLELLATRDDLRSFAVVTFENATEFGLTSNSAFGLRNEVVVQNSVVPTNPSMRPFFVIVLQPNARRNPGSGAEPDFSVNMEGESMLRGVSC